MFAKADLNMKIDLPVKYSEIPYADRYIIREAYIKKQNNRCFYCNAYLNEMPAIGIRQKKIHLELFPDGFMDNPIHLDHDHFTDMTRGAVHAHCNAVMWEYEGE